MKQLSLFDSSVMDELHVGSYEWRFAKFTELDKLSFSALEQLYLEISERYEKCGTWFSDTDYYTDLVIIDIFHSTKLGEFKKKYPKAEVYYKCPPYIK